MRTIISGCVLAVFSFGIAVADDFFFSTSKIEKKDDKWVITGKKKAKKGEEAKEMTYTVDGKVKVFKGKFKADADNPKKGTYEAGDAIDAGFKDDTFKDVSSDKTVNLYLTTEGDKVTRVLVIAKKGKKGTN